MIYEDHQKLENAYDQVLLKEEKLDKGTHENILSKDKNHDFGKDGFCKCGKHRTDFSKNNLCKLKTSIKKEGTEVPNMDVGQDPREGYPEKFDEPEESQDIDQDSFKSASVEIYKLLQGFVPDEKLFRVIELLKDVSNSSVSRGQALGKETWKN